MSRIEEDDVPNPFGLDEPELESEPLEASSPDDVPQITEPEPASALSNQEPSISNAPEAEITLGTPEPVVAGLAPVATTPTPLSPRMPVSPRLPLTPRTPLPPPIVDDAPSSSSEEEDDWPDIPDLVLPPMFLPIPNTDPLSLLLAKHIPPEQRPPRDVTGDWQRADVHTLVMTNSWRALARMARDRLVSTDPDGDNLPLILSLWSLRLSSLARLRLTNQAAAETSNLFHVLDGLPTPLRTRLFDRLLPFELVVLRARTRYWAGDHLGHLDALHALIRRCRASARRAKGEDVAMWTERGARVGLIAAAQLVEMREAEAAAALLEPLLAQRLPTASSQPALRSAIARIYLQGGLLSRARAHFTVIEQDSDVPVEAKTFNSALLNAAEGEWETCQTLLDTLRADEGEDHTGWRPGVAALAAANNLAVALLAQGRLSEAIGVLEEERTASPAGVAGAEPILFNLSTLYELQSVTAAEKKRGLLVHAAKWSGDGLRAACLKMPAS